MKPLELWDWQKVDQDFLARHNWTALAAVETGGAKTMLAVEAIRNSGAERVLIVAPKQTHHSAWIPTVERQLGLTARVIGNGRKADREALADFEWGVPGIYLVTPQFLTRADVSRWEGDMLVVDECFVAGTLVDTPQGPRAIESLSPGDEVFGYDHETGMTVVSVVSDIMDRESESVLPSGSTPNHPYYVVGEGYLPAADLKGDDKLYVRDNQSVRVVRAGVFFADPEESAGENSEILWPAVLGEGYGGVAEEGQDSRVRVVRRGLPTGEADCEILRAELRPAAQDGHEPGVHAQVHSGWEEVARLARGAGGPVGNPEENVGEPRVPAESGGPDDPQQPGGGPRDQRADQAHQESPGGHVRTLDGWERARVARGADPHGRATRLDAHPVSPDTGPEGAGLPHGVQDRRGAPRAHGGCRVRRAITQLAVSATAGRQEADILGGSGVDHLAILQPRSAERYRRVRERYTVAPTRVYNLTTTTGNFFANGALVHNCHELSKAGGKGQRKLSGYSAKDGEPLAQRFVHRLALSGTPARNNFERLWATMRLLWPELGDPGQVANLSHWGWLKERMGSAQVFVGRDMWGAPKYATKWIGERSPGRLFNEAPAVIQHFRRHMCCEFHPEGFLTNEEPMVVVREVELAARQKKAIREMEDHYMTWLGDNPLVADLTITQKQRIRQMCLGVPTVSEEGEVTFEPDCASPFYDELVNILESLDEGEPVVVFVESQKFARVVSDRLNGDGYSAFEYSGKTTSTRNEDLSRFGKDFQVAVVVISAGGTGLDGLQRVANTEVWLERSVDPTLNLQAEARLDRIGSTKGVQRFLIQDDLGYAEGRFSKQLDRMLKLRESTRKEVK